MKATKMSNELEKMKLHSPDWTSENIRKLVEIFPNCVTETQEVDGTIKRAIDYDQLRQELSDHIVDGPQERYHLNWPGKREALLAANAPIAKTLRPARDESVDFDTTQNLFIEGDNLEALKLLQESYLGKIKMIYIDPPYNTGNDFIYDDDFAESADEFLRRSNQKDEKGNRLVANPDSKGRFHSDWLSMMYSRMKLARSILSDDGAVFISIGVEEFSNLKKILDEVFGKQNFIEIFSWVKTSTPPALSTKSRKTNEYIICYEKSKNSFKYKGELLDGGDQPLLNTGNADKELIFPKDKVFFSFLQNGSIKTSTPDKVTLLQDIEINEHYSTRDFSIRGPFKWVQDFLDNEIQKGTSFIIKSEKLSIRFIRDEEGFKRPTNFIKDKYTNPLIDKKSTGVGTNENASSDFSDLIGDNIFDNPKPPSLIKYLLNFLTEDCDLIIDFFAGSSTTAHAVMQLNAEDGGNRKFIMVQLPEECDPKSEAAKAGYANIAEISKERVRRAGAKILEGDCHPDWNKDIGFRTLKVDTSNMKDVYYRPDEVDQSDLLSSVDNIKADRTGEDLLFQVLVDWGVDLTLPIRHEKFNGKSVYFVDDNALVACFETGVNEEFVKQLATHKPLRVVFRDNGFASDDVKANVAQIFRQTSPDTDIKVI